MGISNVSGIFTNGCYDVRNVGKNKEKMSDFTDNIQNTQEGHGNKKEYGFTENRSPADIFQMLRNDGRYEQFTRKGEGTLSSSTVEESVTSNEDAVEDNEETKSKTNIIVKPDGSRVLLITMSFGGMETTMSIEISKPTEMQNSSEQEGEEHNVTASERNATSEEMEGDMSILNSNLSK